MKKASAKIRRKVTTKFYREVRGMQEKMAQHRDHDKKMDRSKKK